MSLEERREAVRNGFNARVDYQRRHPEYCGVFGGIPDPEYHE